VQIAICRGLSGGTARFNQVHGRVLRGRFAEYLGLIRTTIEEGQRAGVFRAELNAKVTAKVLFGALDEMATNWILSQRRYKLAPMVDIVLDIFFNGVQRPVNLPSQPLASQRP